MIPFSALCCTLEMDGARRDCSVHTLSAIGLTCRLPHSWREEAGSLRQVCLTFHRPEGDRLVSLPRSAFSWCLEQTEADFDLWRLETADRMFMDAARQYMADFRSYLRLREGDPALLTEALLHDAPEKAPVFPDDLNTQLRKWFSSLRPDDGYAAVLKGMELEWCLTDIKTALRFLSSGPDRAFPEYLEERGLQSHPLAAQKIRGIHTGSSFCPMRSDPDVCRDVIERCQRLRLRCSLRIPPLRDEDMDGVCDFLSGLIKRAPETEIIVNDLGTLRRVRHAFPSFTLGLGEMAQKRRTDPRLPLVQSVDKRYQLLCENAENAPFYLSFLTSLGAQRLVREACGYDTVPPAMPVTTAMPFYRLNTSTRCALRAAAETGCRGTQYPPENCSRHCETLCFLYPERLRMIGRGNTLFALDTSVLEQSRRLAALPAGPEDRLVLNV